jgi:hypothetical protein
MPSSFSIYATSADAVADGWTNYGSYGASGVDWRAERRVSGGRLLATGVSSAALLQAINDTENEQRKLGVYTPRYSDSWNGVRT